jgi:hypothetical protein
MLDFLVCLFVLPALRGTGLITRANYHRGMKGGSVMKHKYAKVMNEGDPLIQINFPWVS